MSILQTIQRKRKGLVVLVNKWDAVEKETNTMKYYEEAVKNKLAPFRDVPVVFISALEKERIFKAIDAVLEVSANKKTKVSTSRLNEVMLPIIEQTPPSMIRGNHIKIKYITQLPSVTPSFAFFTNYPKDVKDSYRNFLENKLRENFSLTGVPINVFFRKK